MKEAVVYRDSGFSSSVRQVPYLVSSNLLNLIRVTTLWVSFKSNFTCLSKNRTHYNATTNALQ